MLSVNELHNLYRTGSLKTVARECKLDLVCVQEVRWEKGDTKRAEDDTFPTKKGMKIIS
jgi:exonuclease III